VIKPRVKASGLKPEILLAIQEAREVYRDFGTPLVITSLLDGRHSATSLHYEGLAVDLRTQNLDARVRALVAERIGKALGPEYDVVLESDHIHVEYDVR
jgi:hypothetical protein